MSRVRPDIRRAGLAHPLLQRLEAVGNARLLTEDGALEEAQRPAIARERAADDYRRPLDRRGLGAQLPPVAHAGRLAHALPRSVGQGARLHEDVKRRGVRRLNKRHLHGVPRLVRQGHDCAHRLLDYAVHARQALEGDEGGLRLKRLARLHLHAVVAPLEGGDRGARARPHVEAVEVPVVHRRGEADAVVRHVCRPTARRVVVPDLKRPARLRALLHHAARRREEVRGILPAHAQEVVRPQAVGVVGLRVGVVAQLIAHAHDGAVGPEGHALDDLGEREHPAHALRAQLNPRPLRVLADGGEVEAVGEEVLRRPELVAQHPVAPLAADKLAHGRLQEEAAAHAALGLEDEPRVGVLQDDLGPAVAVGVHLAGTRARGVVRRQRVGAVVRIGRRLAKQLNLLDAHDPVAVEAHAQGLGGHVERHGQREGTLLGRPPEAVGVLAHLHVLPRLQGLHGHLAQLVVVIVPVHLRHEALESRGAGEGDVHGDDAAPEDGAVGGGLVAVVEPGEVRVRPLVALLICVGMALPLSAQEAPLTGWTYT